MSARRTALFSTLFAAVLPIVVFFVGAYSYSWGAEGITHALWAPVEALKASLESTCSNPRSGSFFCPYGQGAHNRLFLTSFVLVYFVIGLGISWAIVWNRSRVRGRSL